MKTLRNKVEQRLIKNGNNIDHVKEMIELHFEYVSQHYEGVKRISECIRTIY